MSIQISDELRRLLGGELTAAELEGSTSEHAFDGAVLKVSHAQLSQWRRNYPKIRDWYCTLRVLDERLSENPAPEGMMPQRVARLLEQRSKYRPPPGLFSFG